MGKASRLREIKANNELSGYRTMTEQAVTFFGKLHSLYLINVISDLFGGEDREIKSLLEHFRSTLQQKIRPHHKRVVVNRTLSFLEIWNEALRDRSKEEAKNSENKGQEDQPTQIGCLTALQQFVRFYIEKLCAQIICHEELVVDVSRKNVKVDTVKNSLVKYENELIAINLEMDNRCQTLSISSEIEYRDDPLKILMMERVNQLWKDLKLFSQ